MDNGSKSYSHIRNVDVLIMFHFLLLPFFYIFLLSCILSTSLQVRLVTADVACIL
jgi:hypothetical protein